MSTPLVSHYMRVSRNVDIELSKLKWEDYINCPNIEYLVKFSVLNNIKLDRKYCEDPLKWQGKSRKQDSYIKNEKDNLFKMFSGK